MKYDQLREKALANFESLLEFWGIEFTKINEIEYDFINPTRADRNFGACRFNIEKGRGADFAGRVQFTNNDYARIGVGFTKEDFASYAPGAEISHGFDIIGLSQRIHKYSTYKDGAFGLRNDLSEMSKKGDLIKPLKDAAARRQHQQDIQNIKRMCMARKVWGSCKIDVEYTPGDDYLKSRKLIKAYKEPTIKFHPYIINKEAGKAIPALLLKVQETPETPLIAIHRIYLTLDGKKANLSNPKMALARIKGGGIWFGYPGEHLCIAEGPENALSLREIGHTFVVSTINATNFANLKLPPYVKKVTLFPDPDPAGITNAQKAASNYRQQGKKVIVKMPPKDKKDWNDILCEAGQ